MTIIITIIMTHSPLDLKDRKITDREQKLLKDVPAISAPSSTISDQVLYVMCFPSLNSWAEKMALFPHDCTIKSVLLMKR